MWQVISANLSWIIRNLFIHTSIAKNALTGFLTIQTCVGFWGDTFFTMVKLYKTLSSSGRAQKEDFFQMISLRKLIIQIINVAGLRIERDRYF